MGAKRSQQGLETCDDLVCVRLLAHEFCNLEASGAYPITSTQRELNHLAFLEHPQCPQHCANQLQWGTI